MQNMRIAFFLYEGLTTLDIIGPHDVLSRLPEAEAILEPVAADDDTRPAVVLGEVVPGPDRVALDVVPGREGEEVERPLVPMDGLRL